MAGKSRSARERRRLELLISALESESTQLRAEIRAVQKQPVEVESSRRLEALRRRRASVLLLMDRVRAELERKALRQPVRLKYVSRRPEQAGSPGLGRRR